MLNFYLFEAGATKTTFIKVHENGTEELILPAFNANRDYSDFKSALNNSVELDANSKVYFYGSGCASESNKDKVKDLFEGFSLAHLEIHDDIIAAARSVYGDDSGIIGILGTGGLAAYYNGQTIESRRGGYGYLLGDLGGGFELGKRFLELWLNGDLSQRANAIIADKLEIDRETFVSNFYSRLDLDFVSKMTTYALQFEDEGAVNEMLTRYFDDYLKSNILPLCTQRRLDSFCTIGSVGYLFKRYLDKAAASSNVSLKSAIQYPSTALVEYHRKHA